MNAKRRKVTAVSASPVADDCGKVSEDPGETIDSESSDSEIPYWPAEDDDQTLIDTQEAERFLLKWVPEAESKIRKPHIGVSRWTSWRRKREMETRAKQMSGSKNLFDLWNIDREVRASSQSQRKRLSLRSIKLVTMLLKRSEFCEILFALMLLIEASRRL